jgi:hypothetical protein
MPSSAAFANLWALSGSDMSMARLTGPADGSARPAPPVRAGTLGSGSEC